MSRAQNQFLIDESQRLYFNAESPTANDNAVLWDAPACNPEYGAWSDAVTFIIRIPAGAVTGGPSAWSLGVKFQYEVPHTSGEPYLIPMWSDFDDVGVTSDIVEGQPWGFTKRAGDAGVDPALGGFGVIATEASTFPLTVKRTITNFGRGVRIKLDPAATGGTAPYMKLSVNAVPHTTGG